LGTKLDRLTVQNCGTIHWVTRRGEEFERYDDDDDDDDDDDNVATVSKCRLCTQFDKKVDHIITACPIMAK
jgi:hypothetical protein